MVTKYASNVTFVPKSASNGYQNWYNTDNLKKSSVKATCGQSGNISTVIGGKNGSFHTPSPLTLTGFGFDLAQGTKIEKVVVHYAQQKHSMSSSQGLSTFPAFASPTFTLIGTGKSIKGVAVPTSYTHYTIEFEGVTLSQINSNNFGIKIEYPPNTNTNTGLISLGDVCIEVITSVPRLTVSSSTTNNKIIKSSLFEVEFDVTRLEAINISPTCEITFDNLVSYQKKVDGVGTLTKQEDNSYLWKSDYNNTNSNKIKLQFKAESEGACKINIIDTITNKQYTLTVTIVNYTTTVTSTLGTLTNPVKVGEQVNYNIEIKTNNPELTEQAITVELPFATDIVNISSLATGYKGKVTSKDNKTILTLTAKINNSQATIPINATFSQNGTLTQNILISNVIANQISFLVQGSNIGNLGFSRVKLTEEITACMGNKIEYVFLTLARFVQNSNEKITDYKNNLRVGIYNDAETYVNDEKAFLERVVWSTDISTKNFVLYTIQFVYNENFPVYLVYSHDYMGDTLREDLYFDFTEPVLMEYEYYTNIEDYKEFMKPIANLLQNGDYATCTVPALSSTAPILLYTYNDGGIFDDPNFICQGITIGGNYNVSADVELQFEVVLNGKRGFRNKILQKGSGQFTMGNKYDLFGCVPHDFREHMNEMEVWVTINNPYSDEVLVEMNDINIEVSYFLATDTGLGFEVEGERSEEYGIYFTDFDYEVGTENELKMYQVPGTDDTIPYRMNITDKEITLEIGLDDCDMQENMYMVDKVVKLFTNKRHQLTNKPEPKSIIFDILPDRRFWFIRKESIDSEYGAGTFDGKIKLVIPSGTAQSIEKTVTGSGGSNKGNVAVTPIIQCISKTDGAINISERYRGQSLILNNEDSKISVGDKIIIDNEQPHKVTLIKQGTTTETDITDDVNYSTTWFSLHDEYFFESDDVIITSVEYYEEW